MFNSKHTIHTSKILWVALIFLLFAHFSHLSTLELRAEEPRRATVALEMYHSGEWLIPTIHGWNYYNKPPLFNWILASAFTVFDSTAEWVVRLPALLFWMGTVILLFFFAKKYTDERTAILSSLFLLTFGDLLLYGTVNSGEIDLFLSSLIFLQIVSIFHFEQSKNYFLLFFCSYLFTALGFLTKGLPVCAFQAITLLVYLSYRKKWELLFNWRHFLSIGIFLLIIGSYFYAYHQQSNALSFLSNLVKESAQRSAAEYSFGTIALHFLEFFPNLLKLLLPWSLCLLLLLKKEIRANIWQNNLIRFCLIFAIPNMLLYAFSPGTLNRYLYPFFPFLAIVFAYMIAQYDKIKYRHLLYGVVFLASLRIGYNFVGMPHQQQHLKELIYRDLNEELWRKSEGANIYFTGEPSQWKTELSLFGFPIHQADLVSPPLLPYQISYYLESTGKYIFQFHPQPLSNTFYLTYESFITDKEVDIFHTFHERWTNRQMVLVKFRE